MASHGIIPFFGELKLMEPGFREFIDSNHAKHGNVFTVYSTGSFWTFLSGNENWKKFLTAKENVISSFEFLQQFLKPMQPMEMSMMVKVNESIDFFKISHEILNKQENLSNLVQNIRMVMSTNTISGKIDLFEYVYKMIFYFNMKNFAGDEVYNDHRDEFYSLFRNIDYSKLNVPKEVFYKAVGIETTSQASYRKMEQIWAPIIKKRLEKQKNLSNDDMDILDRVVQLVIQKVHVEKLQVEEHRVVTMIMFNFFIAAQITTSNTCAWMFYKVLQDQAIVKQLIQEINKIPLQYTMEDLQKSTFMEDIVNESVRFGLLGIGGRILKEDVQFEDYIVPKGNIVIHPYFGQGKHFTNFEKFDPNRYSKEPEQEEYNYSFTPFGKGRHPCAGKFVAMFGLKSFLVEVFRNYDVTLLNQPETAPTCMQNFNKQVTTEPVLVEFKIKK
jgi:hypothetical protein